MEFDNNIPIYIQVITDIKKKIIKGELKPGNKMPSARDLALQYKINPNTAARIYKELEQEGICFGKRGLGTFVIEDDRKIQSIKMEMAENIINTFIEGMHNLSYTENEIIELLQKNYHKY